MPVGKDETFMMNKHSILFLTGGWTVGGVERVTVSLANELVRRNYKVAVVTFDIADDALVKDFDSRVAFAKITTRTDLRHIVVTNDIGIILNERCTPYSMTRFIRDATHGLDVGLIAYKHNQPDVNGRIMRSRGVKRWMFKVLTAINAWLTYHSCDAYVLLSPTFIPIFRRFCHVDGKKLYAIGNPLMIRPLPACEKENVICYVGRLAEVQKRVSRILEVWNRIYDKLPQWRLVIVGDGPDRGHYEKLATGLPRVEFLGMQTPSEHYARAKINLLTSDFEGFGLTVVEAKSNGCVPIVLGSYASVGDVVKDGEDGVIIPLPFCVESFGEQIVRLAMNSEKLNTMGRHGRENSRLYDIVPICDAWEELFNRIPVK